MKNRNVSSLEMQQVEFQQAFKKIMDKMSKDLKFVQDKYLNYNY